MSSIVALLILFLLAGAFGPTATVFILFAFSIICYLVTKLIEIGTK
jgi:hypothetical protein